MRRGLFLRAANTKQDVRWSAVLVEGKRVKGKPVQRHIAYLGGITESAIAILAQRCVFWRDIGQRLDQLGDRLSPENRQRVEAAIAARVPRPTDQQFAEWDRARAEFFAQDP
jgi:hypothetical protein